MTSVGYTFKIVDHTHDDLFFLDDVKCKYMRYSLAGVGTSWAEVVGYVQFHYPVRYESALARLGATEVNRSTYKRGLEFSLHGIEPRARGVEPGKKTHVAKRSYDSTRSGRGVEAHPITISVLTGVGDPSEE